MGALLTKYGQGVVWLLPGVVFLGPRPIDPHLKGKFRALEQSVEKMKLGAMYLRTA